MPRGVRKGALKRQPRKDRTGEGFCEARRALLKEQYGTPTAMKQRSGCAVTSMTQSLMSQRVSLGMFCSSCLSYASAKQGASQPGFSQGKARSSRGPGQLHKAFQAPSHLKSASIQPVKASMRLGPKSRNREIYLPFCGRNYKASQQRI